MSKRTHDCIRESAHPRERNRCPGTQDLRILESNIILTVYHYKMNLRVCNFTWSVLKFEPATPPLKLKVESRLEWVSEWEALRAERSAAAAALEGGRRRGSGGGGRVAECKWEVSGRRRRGGEARACAHRRRVP